MKSKSTRKEDSVILLQVSLATGPVTDELITENHSIVIMYGKLGINEVRRKEKWRETWRDVKDNASVKRRKTIKKAQEKRASK